MDLTEEFIKVHIKVNKLYQQYNNNNNNVRIH